MSLEHIVGGLTFTSYQADSLEDIAALFDRLADKEKDAQKGAMTRRARDSHYGSEVAYRDAARVLRQTRLKGSAS